MNHHCEIAEHSSELVYRAKELSLSTAALNNTYLTVVEKVAAVPVKVCHDCPVCQNIYNEKLAEYTKRFNVNS